MPRLEVGGLTLNAEQSGSGPPVVLLHGFTGSTTTWRRLTEVLAPQFEVIAIDIVGHGASDSPRPVERYAMLRCVDDLIAVVRELGHDRASWLGYSMGARTALQLAAHRPEAVDALVLEGVSPGLATADERSARVASDEAIAQRIERKGLEAFVDFWQSISLWNTQDDLPSEVVEAVRQQRMGNSEIGLANSLRGMGTGSQLALHDRLSEIVVPTLLLTGALDEKYTRIAGEMAAEMSHAESCAVPDAGHAVHLERPEAFETAVASFLRGVHGLA